MATITVVASATCLLKTSFVLGVAATAIEPMIGKSISRTNEFIIEPPPKSLRLIRRLQQRSVLHNYEQIRSELL